MAADLDLPIVYGIYVPTGELRHVTDVENGKACDCVCPDPHCGQRLIARNAGTKRIPHFAHESGSCAWSAEYLISILAADVITESGSITFPELTFFDEEKGQRVCRSGARRIPMARAELKELSGRQAPDVVVTWRSSSGSERSFAIVFQLRHTVSDDEVKRLSEHVEGVVVVDLRKHMREAKRRMADKHYDRAEMASRYQDKRLIRSFLLEDRPKYKTWAYSALAERLHAESAERKEAAEKRERRRREEKERRRRAKEERLRREREERAERERRRRQGREEEARRAAEERRREAAEERRREEAMRPENYGKYLPTILPLVDQQERPAMDEFGRHWVRCESCGKVAPDREFSLYGGNGRLNLGTCTECMRKRR
ncbi:MAG: hypothetical protein J6D54_13665 [Olsenella sp.]|nr:hypothetical protein [Olsenella sp.]